MKNRIMLLSILCMVGFLWGCRSKDTAMLLESVVETEEEMQDTLDATQTMEPLTTEMMPDTALKEESKLYVHICGAVEAPGVYELAAGSRICDALDMAGGFLDEACKEYINLAQILSDGQKIYIPTIDEVQEEQQAAGTASWEWKEQNESTADSNELKSSAEGKINLNTATKEQLMTLPGIGASKAESILSYRKEHGSFLCAEDITNVTGIKEATFSQIREYIIVE